MRTMSQPRRGRSLRRVLCVALALMSSAGCAGGQYTSPPNPYTTPSYGGVAYPPGTVVPPAGPLQPQVVMPPAGTATAPTATMPATAYPGAAYPGVAYPQGTLPAGSIPGAVATPTAMPTDLPFGYPAGTAPSAAVPLTASQPIVAPPQAYTAGVPLYQLDQSRPFIDFAR